MDLCPGKARYLGMTSFVFSVFEHVIVEKLLHPQVRRIENRLLARYCDVRRNADDVAAYHATFGANAP